MTGQFSDATFDLLTDLLKSRQMCERSNNFTTMMTSYTHPSTFHEVITSRDQAGLSR